MVQQSLALIEASSTLGLGDTGFASFVLSTARRAIAAHRSRTDSSCVGGEEYSTTTVSTTVSSITVEIFYDAACTEPESLGQFTVTENSATSATISGSDTLYTMAGTIDGYNTLTLSLSVPSALGPITVTDQVSEASSPSSQPFANIGSTCSINSNGNETCSIAVADHSAALNADNAVVENVTETVTEVPSLSETIAGNGSAYLGALNSIGITQQGTATWTVTGGSKVDSATLSATYGYTGSTLVNNAALTISDSANGGVVSVMFNASSQTYEGTLTQGSSGATLATFSVDPTGSGTITYSNGATGTISNGVITS
jgi:hypothetical protein